MQPPCHTRSQFEQAAFSGEIPPSHRAEARGGRLPVEHFAPPLVASDHIGWGKSPHRGRRTGPNPRRAYSLGPAAATSLVTESRYWRKLWANKPASFRAVTS